MLSRLRSLEQLMPFATAGELLMQKQQSVVFVAPGTTAVAALREMEEKDIAFLPVVEGGKLVGVVAERDIARGVILHRRTLVADVMSTEVYTVEPETRVPECLSVMHGARIRHLPVMAAGRVAGVLSVRDLTGSLIERHERLLRKLDEQRVTLLFPYPSSY
jgi:CBS domain-containing protein